MAPLKDTTKESVSALTQLLTSLDLEPCHQGKARQKQLEIDADLTSETQTLSRDKSDSNQYLKGCPHSFFSAAQALASNNPKPSVAPGRPSGYAQRLIRRGQAQAAVFKLRNRRPAPHRSPPPPGQSTNMPGEPRCGLWWPLALCSSLMLASQPCFVRDKKVTWQKFSRIAHSCLAVMRSSNAQQFLLQKPPAWSTGKSCKLCSNNCIA